MQLRKFFRTVPMKLYLILAAVILFSFFSNDFGLVDIQKTAIILAVGIDREDDGFSVTAQIAVPKGSDRTTGGTSSVEIAAGGKTVSDCIANIYAKTGWVPKFVFTNLIVLGEEAAKEDVFCYLNYFLRNKYMPDSCMLAVCEGKAGALISSQSAIDDASALAIGKLFSNASVSSGLVLPNSLKKFSIGYYGPSGSSFLPFIRAIAQEGSRCDPCEDAGNGEGTSIEENGGSGSGTASEGGSAQGQGAQKVYSAEQTALFSHGKMVALLDPELTFVFSLLHGKVSSGNLNTHKGDEVSTLTVLKDKGSISLETGSVPRAVFSLELSVRLCCETVTADVERIANETAPEELLRRAERELKDKLQTLWNTARESGCDLFNLRRSLYRTSLKQYRVWKDGLLGAVEPVFRASVKTKK